MPDSVKPYKMITDFVTGEPVADVGAEANRQDVERVLVNDKGYAKTDIAVNVPVDLDIAGEPYRSRVELVVSVDGRPYMAVKCPAGSLGSCEREVIAAARLLCKDGQLPLAAVSDGQSAIVMDTVSGKKIGEGLKAIPTKDSAKTALKDMASVPLDEKRRDIEKRIYRTYDMENVNITN